MKKTYRFLLAASILLALAFTFSCSSDDNETLPPGTDLSNLTVPLPPETLPPGLPSSKSDVSLAYRNGDETLFKPAGKIENGQLTLQLPSIESGLVTRRWNDCEDCSVSNPQNLTYFVSALFVLGTEQHPTYKINAYLIKSGQEAGEARPFYSSAAGKVTGTSVKEKFNLDLKQGWNLLYITVEGDPSERGSIANITTTLPVGTTVEWRIELDN